MNTHLVKKTIRMHDTDMAGILFFPQQFRLAHEAFEELLDLENLSIRNLFEIEPFIFVIAKAESEYLKPFKICDPIDIYISIAKLGHTSFVSAYEIKKGEEIVGKTRLTHVALDKGTKKPIPLPEKLKNILTKYTCHV